jgi:hypothetical protein
VDGISVLRLIGAPDIKNYSVLSKEKRRGSEHQSGNRKPRHGIGNLVQQYSKLASMFNHRETISSPTAKTLVKQSRTI